MVYALQVTAETYVVGTPLDALWSIGIALIALFVYGSARRDLPAALEAGIATRATGLIMSGFATMVGVGVLVAGTRTYVSTLAVALAGVTLLAAAARTQVAFRQLLRMADLRRQAITDHLTGLPNRRALYVQADARMAEAGCRPQALLLLDLDRFKEVNDSLGHQAGDQLLIQVGARLGEHLRPGDLLVRLGGDEFAVLLDDAGAEQAAAVVFPMADDARAAALVASTIGLAHSLGLRMVAEGVEDDVAYAELARLGCDQAQGYFMSRPVPAAELDHWLNTRDITDEVTEITGLLPSH